LDHYHAGGIFIVGDFCLGTFDRDKVQLRPRFPTDADQDLDGAWLAGWQELWVKGIIGNILRVDALLERGQLSPIFSRKYFCPVGWAGDDVENGAELGDIMLQNTKVNSVPSNSECANID
jgi:hypothetical protein